MVISISCDKAVWDSILSNKAVQDLQGSTASKEKLLMSYAEEQDIAILIMKWVAGFTKSTLSELVEKFALLVSDIFKSSSPKKAKDKPTSELADLLEEKIRSSLLLSVVILLIVVVTRNQS
ncbi:hypothetical protein PHJA_001254400 [Phtheirospermum japonicum]|uniref:Uncharacterized protein n=1 Tax=Phtheirospermum japonicum TaxID=374723 RepID=A0A830C4A0_9LAMI|nr:hypothetical protein PHJA_001254400 [Phtheirospermum japonicum]